MILSKEDLGNLIKSARKIKSQNTGKRYTQEILANDIGISRSYLGDIESGRTYPNYVLLSKIADACNVPFSFFGDIKCNVLDMIRKKYPEMSRTKHENFAGYVCSQLNNDIARTIDLDYYKIVYDEEKNYPKIKYEYDEHFFKDQQSEIDILNEIYEHEKYIKADLQQKSHDIKEAMETILSQPGLMLNGEILSDESKIALANAIKMGLAYAEQMQEKEKENNK